MTKAYIYCRSAIEDAQAIAAQESNCRAFAEAQGLSIASVHSDNGVSGSRRSRPGLDELMQVLGSDGEPAIVLVEDISRISRNHEGFAQIKEQLSLHGAKLVELPD